MGTYLKWTDMPVYRLNQSMLNGAKGGNDAVSEIFESLLFDVENDPKQLQPLKNPELEQKMRLALRKAMEDHDAPVEQYERLGL